MPEFFDSRPQHERGFQILEEPTVTLTADGEFLIHGGRYTGGNANAVRRLVLARAARAMTALRAQMESNTADRDLAISPAADDRFDASLVDVDLVPRGVR